MLFMQRPIDVVPTRVKMVDNAKIKATHLNANAKLDSKEHVVKLVSTFLWIKIYNFKCLRIYRLIKL